MNSENLSFAAGGGDMGERIRAFDWSATELGPLAGWPQGLKTATRIMLASRQPIWIGWGHNLLKLYNDPYKSIVGGKHPWALGRPAREVWRELWPRIGPMLATAMGGDEGTYVEAQLLVMERSGYPEETYHNFSYSPIPDDQGKPGGIICANTDDTRRMIGERQLALLRELTMLRQEATRDLQYRKAQFETLFNQAPLGVYLVDSGFRLREVNPTALPVFGDIPGGIIGRDFDEINHVLWEKKYADEVVAIFRHTLETGESYTTPHRAELRADRGVVEHYEWRVDRTTLPDGSFGVVCCFRDIAWRVEAESTRQLLLRELNHRVKNTLANVQAIAQQTMRSTKDPEEFVQRFSGRIQSLARVHALLSDATWQGADLCELIRDQLLYGPIDDARLTAWGPTVHLQPQMAIHLGVILHELGANSIKYGSLSAPKGWVAVNWTVISDMLEVQWVERGGPPVSAAPRRGFCSALIEQSARSEGGKAEQLIEPEGLTWKISMKLPHVDAQRPAGGEHNLVGPAQPRAAVVEPEAPFDDRRFLVVEDESIIALDLVDTLERFGANEVLSASTEQEGLAMLEEGSFDCALLDANLHGRSVEKIAEALTQRNIPYVFVTGYGRTGLPAGFQKAPVLAKPVSDEQLREAMSALLLKPRKVTCGRA